MNQPVVSGRSIIARALVRVETLDAQGEAVGAVESWLSTPNEEDWAAVYGPRAAVTALPTVVSFIGGLPGERVEVELEWRLPRPGRKHARRIPDPRVRVSQIQATSPERVMPRCPVFGTCGGCQLQHLAYPRQLDWKRTRVAAALLAVGLNAIAVAPTLGCDNPWNYRNHMRFSVDREGRIGLTARKSHQVLPLMDCPIAHPLINRALAVLGETPQPRPQVLVRCGDATGQVLVQPQPDAQTLDRLRATGLDTRTDTLEEALAVPESGNAELSILFLIRPSSFFQTNTAQANRLAETVLAGLPKGPNATVIDAYCGVGAFAALLAPHVGRVLAIEESASAVRDARWNLREAANVTVIQGKTEQVLPTLPERVDGLVIDPPRAGCQRTVLEALCDRQVAQVVYVSCEPTTLARDLAYLCRDRAAYRVVHAQPLDMFPQTAHIETVVWLEALA